MEYIYLALILILVTLLISYFIYPKNIEGFVRDSGKLCGTCADKTYNQCLDCFNCGWCVDKWGNAGCLGGDAASGPYNKEECAIWKTTDPWTTAQRHNQNYKLSYGPKQANRVIGINPC